MACYFRAVYDFFSAAGNGKMTKVQNYVRKNPHSWIVAADEVRSACFFTVE